MASKDVPNFAQVKEFLKNIDDATLDQIKLILQEKEDVVKVRTARLQELLVEYYPEIKSLVERGKIIAAIKFLKTYGYTFAGAECSFGSKEVKDIVEAEFGENGDEKF